MTDTKHPWDYTFYFSLNYGNDLVFTTIQALLVLYLVKVFLLTDDKSVWFVQCFFRFDLCNASHWRLYCDKFLGFRKSIFLVHYYIFLVIFYWAFQRIRIFIWP